MKEYLDMTISFKMNGIDITKVNKEVIEVNIKNDTRIIKNEINSDCSQKTYRKIHDSLFIKLKKIKKNLMQEVYGASTLLILPSVYKGYYAFECIKEVIGELKLKGKKFRYKVIDVNQSKRDLLSRRYSDVNSKLSIYILESLLKGTDFINSQNNEEDITNILNSTELSLCPKKIKSKGIKKKSDKEIKGLFKSLLIGCGTRQNYPSLIIGEWNNCSKFDMETDEIIIVPTKLTTGFNQNMFENTVCQILEKLISNAFGNNLLCLILTLFNQILDEMIRLIKIEDIKRLYITDVITPYNIIGIGASKQTDIDLSIMAHSAGPLILKRFYKYNTMYNIDTFPEPLSLGFKIDGYIDYPSFKYIVPIDISDKINLNLLNTKPIFTPIVEEQLLLVKQVITKENSKLEKNLRKKRIIIGAEFYDNSIQDEDFLNQLIDDIYLVSSWGISRGYDIDLRYRGNHYVCIPHLLCLITKLPLEESLSKINSSNKNKLSLHIKKFNSKLTLGWNYKTDTALSLKDNSFNSIFCQIGISSAMLLEAYFCKIPSLYLCRNATRDYYPEHKLTFEGFVRNHDSINKLINDIDLIYNKMDSMKITE